MAHRDIIDVIVDLKSAVSAFSGWSGSSYDSNLINKLEDARALLQTCYAENAYGTPPGGWPHLFVKLADEPTLEYSLALVKE